MYTENLKFCCASDDCYSFNFSFEEFRFHLCGLCSLLTAGSTYSGGAVRFDVRKGESSSSAGGSGNAKEGVSKAADVIVVSVPRELRGRSEILVFLSDKPVRGT